MKKAMSLKTLGASMLLALGTQQAVAHASNFYVGVDAGATEFSGDGPGKDSIFIPGQKFKDSDTSYGLHVGFQFNDWFAAELGYNDFGSTTDKFKIKPDIVFIVAPNDTQTVDAQGMSLTGVFGHHFTNSFSVLGVLGVSTVNYKSISSGGFSEVTGSLLERHSFSDQGLIYGVGVKYALNDSLKLRADIRRNDVGDFTLDTSSIGLEYSF